MDVFNLEAKISPCPRRPGPSSLVVDFGNKFVYAVELIAKSSTGLIDAFDLG